MSQGVKFYRLGLNSPVTSEFYEKAKVNDGRIVFARVKNGESEAYYIWANGIEYKVGTADELTALEKRITAIEGMYVKSIKTEAASEFLHATPVDVSTGEVTIGIDLTIGDFDASINGLATTEKVKEWVTKQIVDFKLLTYKVVDELPEASKDTMYCIYLIKSTDEHRASQDVYDEWITIENTEDKTYSWELLGNTELNLDNYYTKAEIDSSLAIIDASVNALEDKVNNGVVNSLEVKETEIGAATGYVSVSQDASRGDVTVNMNVTITDSYDHDSATHQEGLTTSSYVEDRFSWITYEGAADIADITPDETTATYKSDESINVASVSDLKVNSNNETTISSTNGEIIVG